MTKQQQHPMKTFLGGDGTEYQRRADIKMRLLREYQNARYTTIWGHAAWLAVFMGKLEETVLTLPLDEQEVIGADAISIDEYHAVKVHLIQDMFNPAAPESEKKSDENSSTAEQT